MAMMRMRMIPAIMQVSKLDEVAHLIKLNKAIAVPMVKHTMKASYQVAYHPALETTLPAMKRQNR
jgi:hypothetical protein